MTATFEYDSSTPEFQERIWDVYRTLRDEHPAYFDPAKKQYALVGRVPPVEAGSTPGALGHASRLPHQGRQRQAQARNAASIRGTAHAHS
jgi:hypothetical protein